MAVGNKNQEEVIMMIVSKCNHATNLSVRDHSYYFLRECSHIFEEIYNALKSLQPIFTGNKTNNQVPYNLIHACIKEQQDMVWDIQEAFDPSQYHKEPDTKSITKYSAKTV